MKKWEPGAKDLNAAIKEIDEKLKELRDRAINGYKNGMKTMSLTLNLPDITAKANKIHIDFTAIAYLKMKTMIDRCTGECGWYGTVHRTENGFLIDDILVYPQMVTGATVNTDQDEHDKWMFELPDEEYNNIHFHGHSHVNMGTTPSGVDLDHRKRVLENLGKNEDEFYIFLIANKRGEMNFTVYDRKTNIEYKSTDNDITWDVILGESSLAGFIETLKEEIREDKPAAKIVKMPNKNKYSKYDEDSETDAWREWYMHSAYSGTDTDSDYRKWLEKLKEEGEDGF